MADENIHMFGHQVSKEHEHKFTLWMLALGGLGTIYLVWKARASAGASSSANGSTQTASTSGASGTGSTTGGATTPANPLPTVEFKFSEDTSNALEYQSQSNVGQSGHGGFSIGGLFSIGGGGSGSNVKSQHVKTGVTNVFTADTIVSNADAGTLKSIEDFLTNLAGSQTDRANTNLLELKSGLDYVPNQNQTVHQG